VPHDECSSLTVEALRSYTIMAPGRRRSPVFGDGGELLQCLSSEQKGVKESMEST
jgi:hypothetical protein